MKTPDDVTPVPAIPLGAQFAGGDALAALILRSATDFAIVTSTPDGIISSWSAGAHNVMGWTAAEAVGRSVSLFFTPEDVAADRMRREMETAREGGAASDERWHVKKDGTRFWASGEMQPLREAGEIVGYVKILRDRTEHHELEQRLRDAQAQAAGERMIAGEHRLREMFEAAPGFIAVFRGRDLVYDFFNASYQRLVGNRARLGATLLGALPEVAGQGYIEKLQAVYDAGTSLTEYAQPVSLHRTEDAAPEVRFVDYVFQPMHDADGKVGGLFLEGFDVTDAVAARAAADKLAAEQAAILGQLGEGVIATYADGRISFVNAAAERLHGVARLDVEPDDYSDTYQLLTEEGDPYPSAELPLARAVTRGETVTEARWRIRRPDGSEVLAIGNAQPVIADGVQVGAVLTVRDDTARRESESALDESRSYLRLLLDSTAEAFYSVDRNGDTTLCNAAFVRMLGFAREEDVLGQKLHGVIHHSHPDGMHYAVEDCPIYRCAQTGAAATVTDELFYRIDGTPFPVEYRVSPILRDGRPNGAICTFFDITDRLAAERVLRETEERYRLAGRATNDAIWDWDLVADRILWNEALQSAFGHAPASGQTSGAWWVAQIHPDDRARVDAGILAVIDGDGESWTDEYRFVRADGTYADVFDRGTVIRDADGRATRMIGAMLDLSERKAAEQVLREREAQFRELADNIPTLCWSANADGHIYWYNKRWYDYTGTSPESQEGWGWESVHDPVCLPLVNERWKHSLATGEPFSMTFPLKGRDGEYRRFLTRIVPIHDDGGRVVRWFGTNLDVEEQSVAEEQERSSDERYRALFDAIESGFCIIEILYDAGGAPNDYRFVEINPAFERQTGLVDAAGRSIRELAPEFEQRWIDLYARVASTREPARYESDSPALGRWFDVNAFPVGKPDAHRVAVLFNDVSVRKNAEVALRAAEARQQCLLSLSDRTRDLSEPREIVAAAVEVLGTYLAVSRVGYGEVCDDNETIVYETDYTDGVEHLIGSFPIDAFGRSNIAALRRGLTTTYADVTADPRTSDAMFAEIETRAAMAVPLIRDGRLRAVLYLNHRDVREWVPDEVALVEDIAARTWDAIERARAEAGVRALNATLENRVAATVAERDMVWRSSQDLFVICGFDGFYRSNNPAWTEVLGYEQDKLIGARFDAFVHPDDVAVAEGGVARLAAGDIVSSLDVRMLHKDGGTRWFSWTCVPQGDVFYASGRDVTARKELEEQLRQSQKMEAVGQLTGGIAHDFNNLLTIVSGNIDTAKRSLGPEGDARALRSLGNAAKGADRAAALTQRLLAFSRRQPLQPRATDVNKLITGMTELLDRALGETIDLQVVAGAGLWRVEVDPNQLENAILNLAVNARDAMPAGGKLTVETSNSAIDEAYVAAHREVVPGQYVMICVTDTGEGMPADVVAKAFDPFFSTKDVGKGTGLGLSQVYGYVKQSGGHVKIYSEVGEGTSVKVYLPRLIADMNAADEVEAVPEAPTQGQESILVVEDDDDVRIFTVDSLRELGYRVLEAHDGASALRLLERQEEPPRLLLTDVVMPGMSGRELADEAGRLYPEMRVLYTTGYARNAIVHGGRLDPGVELLPKPFTFEALAAKIREVIEKDAVGRALVIDPADETRGTASKLLEILGFAAEPAGTVREALSKLRAAGGRFDVVILDDAVPVGNLDAVIAELHAVRSDLPILIVGASGAEIDERYFEWPCVGGLASPYDAIALRDALRELRVRCAAE